MQTILTWTPSESWVAIFDVLGFKNRLEQAARSEISHRVLTGQINDLIASLDSDARRHGRLNTLVFSDTIVVYTWQAEPRDYPWFLQQCRHLMTESIRVRLPLRGAISVGRIDVAKEYPIVLGRPLLEAHAYAEGQDWVGLLTTPSATTELRRHGLDPLHHDFVADALPLRPGLKREDVLAYRFQNGSANFESWLIPLLREMRQQAPDDEAKAKYDRTIAFISKHYSWLEPPDQRGGACDASEH